MQCIYHKTLPGSTGYLYYLNFDNNNPIKFHQVLKIYLSVEIKIIILRRFKRERIPYEVRASEGPQELLLGTGPLAWRRTSCLAQDLGIKGD